MDPVIVRYRLKVVAPVKPLINGLTTETEALIFSDIKIFITGIGSNQIVVKVQGKFSSQIGALPDDFVGKIRGEIPVVEHYRQSILGPEQAKLNTQVLGQFSMVCESENTFCGDH